MRKIVVLLVLGLTVATFVHGEQEHGDEDDDFQVVGIDAATIVNGGVFDVSDSNFMGNPIAGVSRRWPEDLVIAPIPGRSPQIGWNLTLAAGYFFDNAECTPSAPMGQI